LAEFSTALRSLRHEEDLKRRAAKDLAGAAAADIFGGLMGRRVSSGYAKTLAEHSFGEGHRSAEQQLIWNYRQRYGQWQNDVVALVRQLSIPKPKLVAPGNSYLLVQPVEAADIAERLEMSIRRVLARLRDYAARNLVWNSSLPTSIPEPSAPNRKATGGVSNRTGIAEIWLQYRRQIEEALAGLALKGHLDAIEQGLDSANPEQWRAAVFSCRNLLVDLADRLWRDTRAEYEHLPGTGKHGKLEVTHEKASNRLSAYLHQKGLRDNSGRLLRDEMDRLAASFRSLLAAQGSAHRPVKRRDAEAIAITTCMLVGQLASGTDMEPVQHYKQPADETP